MVTFSTPNLVREGHLCFLYFIIGTYTILLKFVYPKVFYWSISYSYSQLSDIGKNFTYIQAYIMYRPIAIFGVIPRTLGAHSFPNPGKPLRGDSESPRLDYQPTKFGKLREKLKGVKIWDEVMISNFAPFRSRIKNKRDMSNPSFAPQIV